MATIKVEDTAKISKKDKILNHPLAKAVKTGVIRTFQTMGKVIKILVPVYLIVKILEHSGALVYIAAFFQPVMVIFGLPGETALPLILANSINIYAGVAALATITLTTKQVTTLGLMILISHSLPVESSILKNLDVPRYLQVILRVSMGIIIGVITNLVWGLFA